MPALTWNAAKGAAQYEVQIASDSGFNPALIDVTTQNLRFVNAKMLPNGAYFWRVRSIDAANDSLEVVGRAQVHEEVERRGGAADAREPEHDRLSESRDPHLGAGAGRRDAIACPSRPAQPAAASMRPAAIISKGALAWNDNNGPITTSNTNLAVSTSLHPGTYYWQVVPVDAEGNAGAPSAIFSFVWLWPGTTTPTVTDMVPGVEIYDPLFQWARDSGRRELRDGDQHHVGLRDRLQAVQRQDRPRRRSLRARRCRTTRTTGAFAASTRRARPAPGTTARPSTRPTTRPRFPGRPT